MGGGSNRSIFLASDPVAILEDLMYELRWKQRLLAIDGIQEPIALCNIPRSPNYLLPETVEIRLRWFREVKGGRRREGANMERMSSMEVHLLSRSAIKERMENWFCQVVEKIKPASV